MMKLAGAANSMSLPIWSEVESRSAHCDTNFFPSIMVDSLTETLYCFTFNLFETKETSKNTIESPLLCSIAKKAHPLSRAANGGRS